MKSNNALQRTFDTLPIFGHPPKNVIASNASELRRYRRSIIIIGTHF